MQLAGKIVLITGGTRGIGAATALALAREGADVAIVGRNADAEAAGVRDAILKLGRRCEIIQADCSHAAEATRCVKETELTLGHVAVLVHCAGGPVNGGLLQLTPETWNAAFDLHVHAIFHLSRAVIPSMQAKKEGAIILISSVAGIRGVVTNPAYQVVKGALPQFARALAREFAADNIRVNCVAPGIIRTAFHSAMSAEQKKINLEQRIPLRREGTPEQVADAIAMLAKNDYITGETLTVDGGLTMRIA
jgi:NAD(P)-dependent dehydrogenase (short-subunit alcohol dehydrogenase family)